jgi:hypothetical protein
MLELPVSFRIFAAFLAMSTGTYVSGMMKRNGKVAPANIRPSQKHHRQLTVAMKPDASGPKAGPKVVAPMKTAIAIPLFLGSPKISA